MRCTAAQGGGSQVSSKKFNFNRRYSHKSSRALQRNVSNKDIEDAISNPIHIKKVKFDNQGRPSQQYIGKNATVVKNPNTGKIITTWRTGIKTLKKYGGAN